MEHEEKATTWLEACRFIDPEDEKAAGFETTNQNLAMTTTLNTTVLQLAGAWAHEETHFRWEEAGSGSSCLHCGFYAKVRGRGDDRAYPQFYPRYNRKRVSVSKPALMDIIPFLLN